MKVLQQVLSRFILSAQLGLGVLLQQACSCNVLMQVHLKAG